MTELLDARGVLIEPGDVALYGFSVSRSVALAEAIVMGVPVHADTCGPRFECTPTMSVSVTPKGRVRLRVVRRSYSDGEKPTVDVAPDRLVVLKREPCLVGEADAVLPPSPLPTQDEVARAVIQKDVDQRVEALRMTAAPRWWMQAEPANVLPEVAFANFAVYQTKRLAEARRKLKAIDDAS